MMTASRHPRGPVPDPRPRSAAVRMVWSDLLFMHWPVPAEALRPLVPQPLQIDEFEGRAWVGLIPFSMPLVRPRWVPEAVRWRGITDFHECNVRTYVHLGGGRGVYFFSLDASSRPAVWSARRCWHLPYRHARIDLARLKDERRYELRRAGSGASLSCRWRTGARLPASRPGELAHFLTERYALYTVHRGQVRRGAVEHAPWPLRSATLLALRDSLVDAAGIRIEGEPIVHAADPLEVIARALEEPRGEVWEAPRHQGKKGDHGAAAASSR